MESNILERTSTRGLYLNNPACIRLSNANHWKGLSLVQKDKEFCTFDNICFGIRALIMILRTYTYTYKLSTVRSIISRYAPVSENNTEHYISVVSKLLVGPDSLRLFIDRKHPTDECYHLCYAICFIESGLLLTYNQFRKAASLL